eukprot:3733006-Alexandrium_andersonii.AAC.1
MSSGEGRNGSRPGSAARAASAQRAAPCRLGAAGARERAAPCPVAPWPPKRSHGLAHHCVKKQGRRGLGRQTWPDFPGPWLA